MSNIANKSQGGDLGLSLTGMRIAPREPTTQTAKVGHKQEVFKPDHSAGQHQARVLKERTGFSGGFKIPEEYRKNKAKQLGKKKVKDENEDLDATNNSHITKEEIYHHLNLGTSESAMGVGRHGTNTKTALAKDLVEGIEKDLDKLRRQQENIQLRKTLVQTGQKSFIEETDLDRENDMAWKLRSELETAGTHVIAASPKKLQVMRHQASQLQSNANLNLEDLEAMRKENEQRLKELEEIYYRQRQNASVGKIIREKMGYGDNSPKNASRDRMDYKDKSPRNSMKEKIGYREKSASNLIRDQSPRTKLIGGDKFTFGSPDGAKQKKFVRIAHHQDDDEREDRRYQYNDNAREERTASLGGGRHRPLSALQPNLRASKSRSPNRKRAESPEYQQFKNTSPRRQIYEAKFEKYVANKENKKVVEQKFAQLEKEDFDRFTKGPESPSKQTKRYKDKEDRDCQFNRYDAASLIPNTYDEDILREEEARKSMQQSNKKDQFKMLGVSNEDKMTFFLLKWIFNAIKRESALEDPKLKGKAYITKSDLIKQLIKNDELMSTLGYSDHRVLKDAIINMQSVKDGCLMWDEFLDFFFNTQNNRDITNTNNVWWKKIDKEEEKDGDKAKLDDKNQSPQKTKDSFHIQPANIPRYGRSQNGPINSDYEDPDRKPVKVTPSLQVLQDTRKSKLEKEVETEFKTLQEKKLLEQKSAKQQPSPLKKSKKDNQVWDLHQDQDETELALGIKREKSQCLLLQSQIHILQEIFKAMDKYNDQILRRSEYIMHLRTDERVVEFIDVDAVKLAGSTRKLTLDEILVEIEKDEMYEMVQKGKNNDQINHKEFITWREFINYFVDYREVEDRNRKTKEIQRTRQSIQKEKNLVTDQSEEIQSIMEQEKERRLKELPKLRPADQIDISEKQLQLLKDIYDSLQKIPGAVETVHTIDFFIAIRKNPQVRTLSSAIARDPDGTSRLHRETFQQVFDRMENEIQHKQLEWATIVEYFTKRGRPLTKDEILRLQEEDKQEREEAEAKKRAEEEAERRRMARLMEDIEDNEDFEEFEMRQKNQQAAKLREERKYRHRDSDEEDRDEDDTDNYMNNDDRRYKRRRRRNGDDSQDQDDYDEEYDDERDEDFYEDEDDDDDFRRRTTNDRGFAEGGYTSDPELNTAQRNYKFGQPSSKQRAVSSRNIRPKSAKTTFDNKDLRNVKLTTKDYLDNERGQRNTADNRFKITVPKPFEFDMREKGKAKGIREKRLDEMVAQKRIEEENLIKHQFRSNPIPPEVLIPRYQTIMENKERRREEVKRNSMAQIKATEKPFSFYERDRNKQQADPEEYLPYDLRKPQFKANPIPRSCSVLIFDQMTKQHEQKRQERIRKNAELNYSKAKLPERMQMHEEKKKQMPPKQNEADSYAYKPKINELVTREQFKKQQEKFNQKLNKKKGQMQVTRPKSPNFTKTNPKALEREYLNEGQQAQPVDKFKAALLKSMAKGEDAQQANPSSTKGTMLAMQRRREELEAKRKKEELTKKEDMDREARQSRMKNVVQAAFADKISEAKEKQSKLVQDKKSEIQKSTKEYSEKIKLMEQRVKGRPLLVESLHQTKQTSNLAKIQATKQYLDILKASNLNPNDHLTDEQKELLEEEKYKEAMKKQLGR